VLPPAQHLESKAEQRNPDEFYFAMEKAKTKDGVHIQRQAAGEQRAGRAARLAAVYTNSMAVC
jgi:U3 small nucleolar RNA-associated protein 11